MLCLSSRLGLGVAYNKTVYQVTNEDWALY